MAAWRAGQFTVSSAYARRYAEQAAKSRRATEANAWRVEADVRAQPQHREAELRRQSELAAQNGRAIAAKEREDRQRLEALKERADAEARWREAYNATRVYW